MNSNEQTISDVKESRDFMWHGFGSEHSYYENCKACNNNFSDVNLKNSPNSHIISLTMHKHSIEFLPLCMCVLEPFKNHILYLRDKREEKKPQKLLRQAVRQVSLLMKFISPFNNAPPVGSLFIRTEILRFPCMYTQPTSTFICIIMRLAWRRGHKSLGSQFCGNFFDIPWWRNKNKTQLKYGYR